MAAEAERAELPENLAAAHQLIGKLQHENKWLRHRLEVLSRKLFGKKTEQLTPEQLTLAYEQLDSEIDKSQRPEEPDSVEAAAAEKTRSQRGRRSIPKNIRRVDVVLDIPEQEKTGADCGVAREQIGEEISEKYDYIPAELVCRVTHRPKYGGCKCRPGVLVAAPAPQAIEKGLAVEGLLAWLLTSKYVDHLSLYRLEGILARHGADISRQTLCDWVASCADAYSAYSALYRMGRLVEVGCWTQARRKFFDTREQDPEAMRVLALIGKLYEVERQATGLTHE